MAPVAGFGPTDGRQRPADQPCRYPCVAGRISRGCNRSCHVRLLSRIPGWLHYHTDDSRECRSCACVRGAGLARLLGGADLCRLRRSHRLGFHAAVDGLRLRRSLYRLRKLAQRCGDEQDARTAPLGLYDHHDGRHGRWTAVPKPCRSGRIYALYLYLRADFRRADPDGADRECGAQFHGERPAQAQGTLQDFPAGHRRHVCAGGHWRRVLRPGGSVWR